MAPLPRRQLLTLTGQALAAALSSPPVDADAMKLPQGWRVYALVLALNALALTLWWLDRDVAPTPASGGIGAWLTARLGS